MAKKKSKKRSQLRDKWPYTMKEIAEKRGVHIRTVQSWQEKGLEPIGRDEYPRLFYGRAVRDFEAEQKSKRKMKQALNEFLCLRCKKAKVSDPEKLVFLFTGKRIGRCNMQVRIKGSCIDCGCELHRSSTVAKANEAFGEEVVLQKAVGRLSPLPIHLSNTDKKRKSK